MSKTDTVRVRPRPGIILAGIPAEGTDVDKDLADEWVRNGLVVRVKPEREAKPVTPAKEG